MNCKKVLIHDSARPNPSKDLINKIIYLKEAAILPPSTVRTAPVVFFEVAK